MPRVLYSSTPAENSRTSVQDYRLLLSLEYNGVSAQASESPVLETVQGTKDLSENTFDNNQKVNPSELSSEVAIAVAKMPNP